MVNDFYEYFTQEDDIILPSLSFDILSNSKLLKEKL